MRRTLAWIGGAFGAAAFVRLLRRRRTDAEPTSFAPRTGADPADDLRRRLAEARAAPDDRDDFDAAEGVPVDQAEPAAGGKGEAGVEERRRAVHERGRAALEGMRGADDTPDSPDG